MGDDVRLLLGNFAGMATDADIARLSTGLAHCKKAADKEQVLKEFKKMLRNRRGVREAVVAAPITKTKVDTGKSTVPAVAQPQPAEAVVEPTGAAFDDDEFELDALF